MITLQSSVTVSDSDRMRMTVTLLRRRRMEKANQRSPALKLPRSAFERMPQHRRPPCWITRLEPRGIGAILPGCSRHGDRRREFA